MVNNISSRGLLKTKSVDVLNFPGTTSTDILTKADDVLEKSPNQLSFNIITNDVNLKWLINCSYNPNNSNIRNHLEAISRTLDAFSAEYENILLLGNFNACDDEKTMKNLFCSSYCLKSVIKQPTCFKNPENPTYIDLIMTNKRRCFQRTCLTETGRSDFRRMIVSVLKMYFHKLPSKVISRI